MASMSQSKDHMDLCKTNGKVPGILLICAFKNSADLAMLDLLLPISGSTSDISQVQLQIEAYITREKEQPVADANTEDAKNLHRTIWFKPDTSHAPVSAALGLSSWLWLCAIISSSSIMFLLFLGIVTQYYIYPIDQGSDESYHYSFRCLWDMFFVCASIFLGASSVFPWHRKRAAMEGKQIQNIEVPSPVASPGSWLHGKCR